MLSEEEREEIINLAVERTLLSLPAVVGNLMANHAALAKMNSQFYKDYPEFVDHKDSVVAILEKVDGEDTLASYEDKLKKAVPLIRERIKTKNALNMSKVDNNVNRDFATKGNGVL